MATSIQNNTPYLTDRTQSNDCYFLVCKDRTQLVMDITKEAHFPAN